MPNPARRRLALVAALSTVLVACSGEAPKQAPMAGSVTVVTLKASPFTLTRELPGRTNAFAIAEVRPQVSGVVKERLFTEGALVKAGEPLYQLDDAAYRADVAGAKAALARAEALVESARLKAARTAELARIDAVSAQENEDASAALRQAEADVGVARAKLDAAGVVLERARISSPIGGRIGKSSVTAGALVTANQAAALATVQRLDPIYVDVAQSSTELLALRRGLASGRLAGATRLPVTILLEDGSRYEHDGRLAFSEVSVDPATGSYSLRIVVPNPDGLLLPGIFVRALVPGGIREDALLVPQKAVTRDPQGKASVMVVGADSKVEPRAIRVSHAIDGQWLVEEGLAAGDRVIVEGLQKIAAGMPVQATEAGAAGPTPGGTPAATPATPR